MVSEVSLILGLRQVLLKIFLGVVLVTLINILIFNDVVAQESIDSEVSDEVNFTLEEGQQLPRSTSSTELHNEVKAVLSGEDFSQKETVTRRRFIDFFDNPESVDDEESLEDSKHPPSLIKFFRILDKISELLSGFALLLEIVLWGALIAGIVFILYKYREQISNWASDIKDDAPEAELPTTLFGLDIQKDSVSDDVVAEAQSYWQVGEKRLAIASLLRASLITLLHEHQCRFFSSDTEAECCDRIDQQVSASISAFMRLLVSVWQRIAYAHIEPRDAQFDQLCKQWPELFA